jgi:type III pantothenate kinase
LNASSAATWWWNDERKTIPERVDGMKKAIQQNVIPRGARVLLLDIGNTHTHVGFGTRSGVRGQTEFPTADWFVPDRAAKQLRALIRGKRVVGVSLCSVVPKATVRAVRELRRGWGFAPLVLTHDQLTGIGVDYPRPETIGPDRLANAVALRHEFGAPALAVAFGTAVAFDVIDARGNYVGGIIAPGLSAMTNYLHEKTALLPQIKIREIGEGIGKSTREAMLIGAVHGYRGLIRGLITAVKRELGVRRLPVVATGGYATLMARGMPEIAAVRPDLTLAGLRLTWLARSAGAGRKG